MATSSEHLLFNKDNCDIPSGDLSVVSLKMHGFNHGFSTIRELTLSQSSDIFLIQEQWLTPDNVLQFDKYCPDYSHFRSSAMLNSVTSGVLRGRPFGDTPIIYSKNLQSLITTITCSELFNIIRVSNILLINVYLPCSGTVDRLSALSAILADI